MLVFNRRTEPDEYRANQTNATPHFADDMIKGGECQKAALLALRAAAHSQRERPTHFLTTPLCKRQARRDERK